MGRPSPGVPLSIIDANGQVVGDGEEGDISLLIGDSDRPDAFFGIFDGYVKQRWKPVTQTENVCLKRLPTTNMVPNW